MWAIEHYGVEPDLLVSGKSLGGGLPLAGVTGGRRSWTRSGPAGSAARSGATPSRARRLSPSSTRWRRVLPTRARARRVHSPGTRRDRRAGELGGRGPRARADAGLESSRTGRRKRPGERPRRSRVPASANRPPLLRPARKRRSNSRPLVIADDDSSGLEILEESLRAPGRNPLPAAERGRKVCGEPSSADRPCGRGAAAPVDAGAAVAAGPESNPSRATSCDGRRTLVRVFMVYEQEPDAGRYEQHASFRRQVPGGTFRHGKVFGAPMGKPKFPYYAEWEFPTATPSRPPRARTSSWRPARTRWRWACPSTSTSPMSNDGAVLPGAARPVRARLRGDRLREGASRATITLNRPEVLNAFDFRMLREIARACEDASWDDSIRVVVVTGAGGRSAWAPT